MESLASRRWRYCLNIWVHDEILAKMGSSKFSHSKFISNLVENLGLAKSEGKTCIGLLMRKRKWENIEKNWILSSFILKRVFYTPVNSLRSSSDSFILASSNYQIHTYFIEQYPPSANSKNVASGNAQRLKRAAAADLQKSRNPETLCVVNQAQVQILYRKGIKQN